MEKKEIVKEYSNGDFTVVWKPGLCMHAEICAKTLPKVYNPTIRPWIKAENASIDELTNQIDRCPSGALSYYMKGEQPSASESAKTEVHVMANGPLVVAGSISVTDPGGESIEKSNKTAFCRCGGSSNKPYCDGSHSSNGFQG